MNATISGGTFSGYLDIRQAFSKTLDGNNIGAGTHYPFGLTFKELDELFLSYKKLSVNGTFPGMQNTETKLLGFPADGLRQNLFSSDFEHNVDIVPSPDDGGPSPMLNIRPGGYLFGGKYYPYVEFQYVNPDPDPEGNAGAYVIIDNPDEGYDEAGELRFKGQSTPIYAIGPDYPGGNVNISDAEKWVP